MRTIEQICGTELIEVVLQKGYLNEAYFMDKVFGEKPTWFHLEWLEALRNHRFLCIVSARGTSKTTVLGVRHAIYMCMYQKNKNILIISNALSQSVKIMGQIREAIESNELLKDLVPENKNTTWSKTELHTKSGCKIFCLALTENVRGLRNDYVLADEGGTYEDQELFRKVIEPTVDLRKGTIVVIGTPKSQIDLLSTLQRNKLYWSKMYPMIQNGTSIWPEMYSNLELERIRLRIGDAAFQSEYLCSATAEVENTIFPAEQVAKCIDYSRKFTSVKEGNESFVILACDFAIAQGPQADFDSYTVVEKFGGKTYLKWGERYKGLSISAKAQRIKELFDLHGCESIIIDPSHIGTAVRDELRDSGLPVYEASMHSAGRSALLVNLKRMIENKELIIPYSQDDSMTRTYVTILISELVGFKQIKSAVTESLLIRSTTPHDDTAISLAMGCKRAAQKKEFIDLMAVS